MQSHERIGMKIGARNQIKGQIVAIDRSATTSHVKIDIGGSVVTAAITKTSVEEMGPSLPARRHSRSSRPAMRW